MPRISKKGTTWTAVWDEQRKRWKLDAQVKGKRKSFYSKLPGRKGAEDCSRQAHEWKSHFLINGDSLVRHICDAFIESLKQERSPSSAHWKKHESICRVWIIPRIGDRKMDSIEDIEPLQAILYDAFDAGLCRRSIANIRTTIVDIFKYARIKKASKFMPEGLAVSRYAPTKGRPALSISDIIVLMDNDYTISKGKQIKELYVNAFRLEMILGSRPGEIVGLKNSDRNGDYIRIERAINTQNEETLGKNENAIRPAKLPPLAIMVLDRQKQLLEEYGIDSDYIFPSASGGHIHQTTYRKHWYRYRDTHGLKPGSTPYSLRNTALSVYKDIPKPRLDPVVGHSENFDTWGVYGREMEGDLDIVAEEMTVALSRILGYDGSSDPRKDTNACDEIPL
ncbi:tyrosine-type recombinase/integrase [Oscillibacter sp.]|uniref:tyrosine-type recombinase/integrase n=1 Tax=Oscillibacter sp. TaxID=1945593 RepID=UPI001B6950AB|nr:hypothetical protein [Oscillibacter sp.]MBP3509187.1 hypothetical protein [Oscillibacter sp.]